MRIIRLRIRDFRSVEALDVEVPPSGMSIAGPNEVGKTNIVRAIRTTLTGVGVAPDAIREGASDCEILVDTDDPKLAHIRQLITPAGGTLTVKNPDGDRLSRPRERLKELFGLSCFDPLAFYRASAAEQRRMVLAAMPVTVTAEDLAKWTGNNKLPLAVDLGRNGLEVIELVRKAYYDLRASANKAASDAEAEYRRALDEAERLVKPDHVGVLVPLPGEEDMPVCEARKAVEVLEQRKSQAEEMAARTEGTRARIAKLREDCKLLTGPSSIRDTQGLACARAEFEEAKESFERARKHMDELKASLDKLEAADKAAKALLDKAEQCHIQADELEATLAETSIEPPTLQELADADQHLQRTEQQAALVRSARAEHDAHVRAAVIGDEAKSAHDEAARLDTIVQTLAVDAPTELAARANLVPGLSVTEDGVLYRGRPLDDSMSGAQRMLVAVQIAKLANAKAGLLMVDEIGVLDEQHMREFVRLCTAEGWQLIATCMRNTVDKDGNPTREMVLEAIELDGDDNPLDPKGRVKVIADGREIA